MIIIFPASGQSEKLEAETEKRNVFNRFYIAWRLGKG